LPLGAVAASVFDLITDRKRQERRIMADGNTPVNSGGVAQDQLRSVVERIERLEEEKAATMADIKEVYAEAKANGFDTKTLRQVIRIRKQDKAERQEQEAILDLYLHALGMSE
jgi:uncharacterized protein (UPF0335 family)